MAKSKGLNPADAHRKNQRKKEVQKNKEARKKARELTTAKQDTGPIEEEIESIEAKPSLSAEDKGKLSGLRAELKGLLKAKEEYLKEHPEHRTLVYASAHKRQRGETSSRVGDPTDRKVFGKDGLPLRPERSIYYDPVMNPYGIPPPGMLYMERPATPNESQMVDVEPADDSSSEEDEDDIRMPPGPPPGGYSDDSSEDEGGDVPMPAAALPLGFIPPLPKGPPPPNAVLAPGFMPPPPPFPPHPGFTNTPFPPHPPGPPPGAFTIPPPPPPPPGFPPVFPLNMPSPYVATNLPPGAIPPPPFGFPNFPPNFPPQPPRPPRDFRRGITGPTHHFDPLSVPGMVASQPYQAYHHHPPSQSTPTPPTVGPPSSSLPNRPAPAPVATTSTKPTSTNAPLALDDTSGVSTIFAAPELRDFKKEATAFVPRGIRQKAQAATIGSRVNAAPIPTSTDGASPNALEDDGAERPDLMKALAKAGITGAGASGSTSANAAGRVEKEGPPKNTGNEEQQNEYERFMDDIGDLLK